MNSLATFYRESKTARFLIPVGIMLIVFGVIVFVINSKNQNYVEVESTVVNVVLAEEEYTDSEGNHFEATYDVTVKYTVDGKEYEGVLNGLSKYTVNDKIKIYYNPKDPSKITQTKSMILPIAFILGGIASLIGGIISAKNAIKRHIKMKEQEKGWKNE